jgi:hypothetical protein
VDYKLEDWQVFRKVACSRATRLVGKVPLTPQEEYFIGLKYKKRMDFHVGAWSSISATRKSAKATTGMVA